MYILKRKPVQFSDRWNMGVRERGKTRRLVPAAGWVKLTSTEADKIVRGEGLGALGSNLEHAKAEVSVKH